MYNLFFFKICHARYLVFNLCHSRGFVHHGNDKKSKLFHTNVHKTLTNVWEKTNQISSNLYSVDKNSLYPQPAITENNILNSESVMPDI